MNNPTLRSASAKVGLLREALAEAGDELGVDLDDVELIARPHAPDNLGRDCTRARPYLQDAARPFRLPHWPRHCPGQPSAGRQDRARRMILVAKLPIKPLTFGPVAHDETRTDHSCVFMGSGRS